MLNIDSPSNEIKYRQFVHYVMHVTFEQILSLNQFIEHQIKIKNKRVKSIYTTNPNAENTHKSSNLKFLEDKLYFLQNYTLSEQQFAEYQDIVNGLNKSNRKEIEEVLGQITRIENLVPSLDDIPLIQRKVFQKSVTQPLDEAKANFEKSTKQQCTQASSFSQILADYIIKKRFSPSHFIRQLKLILPQLKKFNAIAKEKKKAEANSSPFGLSRFSLKPRRSFTSSLTAISEDPEQKLDNIDTFI